MSAPTPDERLAEMGEAKWDYMRPFAGFVPVGNEVTRGLLYCGGVPEFPRHNRRSFLCWSCKPDSLVVLDHADARWPPNKFAYRWWWVEPTWGELPVCDNGWGWGWGWA